MSRTAQFEQKLTKKPCPRCGKKRLIPRFPGNTADVRCLECGTLFTRRK